MHSTFTRSVLFSVFFLLSFINIIPQDITYYSTVSVTSPTFVTDLEARVRSPFQSRTYSEYRDILIPNYESVATGVGSQRRVTCAYSGFTWDYTPPFAFGSLFSREHTYCQSWWDVASSSNPYYSDFHHLFLTEQPHANGGMRGNNPLGDCATVTTTFLECKLGKNTLGQTVFEPRAGDKGDAARGLMYMVIMYDHNGSYGNWNFKWLNETKIPSTPQDIQTLLNWSKQDPPDRWEVERNNYIASLQQNRNPFVDHPEYLKYVSLYDMTKLSPVFQPEPTSQVSNFTAIANGTSITVNWTNPSDGQIPSGFLLQAYDTNNYFIPIDGDLYQDNTNLAGGKALINIPVSATSYTFDNLTLNKNYYFTIYSYNGSDSTINYKIDAKQRANVIVTGTTPVELTSFTAAVDKDNVNLIWKTASELNNKGYDIQRGSEKNADGDIIFNNIGFVKGAGSSLNTNSYLFSDKLNISGKYYYRLKQIDNDGSFKLSSAIEVNFKPVVKGYYLEQNYPNPFNPSTTIAYSLPEASNVKLSVYNALGQQIRILENVYKNAGNYSVNLNADDFNSGIYFYKIEAGQFSQIRKMILMK